MSGGSESNDPHAGQPVRHFGAPLAEAIGAVILLHGRGASAEDILNLAHVMHHPGVAYLAPAAADHTWYPYSFLAPREQNEPWLSSALHKIAATVQRAIDCGLSTERIVICGFSQGACLTTEFIARHPARYAGLIALTGGLIGPSIRAEDYPGDLKGTPAFLGSGDPDPHVPWTRVEESAQVLTGMQAKVTIRRYPGRPHTVSGEEVQFGRQMIVDAFAQPGVSIVESRAQP